MKLWKELDLCYIKAERMANTDANEKLLFPSGIQVCTILYCTVIVLFAYLERNRC